MQFPKWADFSLSRALSELSYFFIAINTINESGKSCELNNPCEVAADGGILFEKGYGYAQGTVWIYSCRNAAGAFDSDAVDCHLPKAAW